MSGLAVAGSEHDLGAVDLVAGGAEALAERAEVGAAGYAVLHEPGRFGAVGIVARAGVDAQLGLQRGADGSGVDEVDQAAGEVGLLRAGGEPDGQPAGGEVVDGLP